jgi:hypothetical protein
MELKAALGFMAVHHGGRSFLLLFLFLCVPFSAPSVGAFDAARKQGYGLGVSGWLSNVG